MTTYRTRRRRLNQLTDALLGVTIGALVAVLLVLAGMWVVLG